MTFSNCRWSTRNPLSELTAEELVGSEPITLAIPQGAPKADAPIAPNGGPATEITVLTKSGGPLTKRISLGADGAIKSDGSACVMASGEARRMPIANAEQLAALIGGLAPNQAITLGRLRPGLVDVVQIVTKSRLNGGTAPNVIARTADNIVFETSEPAWALLDYDRKGMPPDVMAKIERRGGFWGAIVDVVPALAKVARVERASTSAGLNRSDTGEQFPGSGGQHVYPAVRDGADIGRFLKTLHDRCWLAGLGWYMVGASGHLLERSIIDRMVGTPERIVFEGDPVLKLPIAQDREARRPIAVDGNILDTMEACPPLTETENAQLTQIKAEAAHKLAGEASKARAGFIAKQAKRLAERAGVSVQDAERTIEFQSEGVLLPDIELPFDDKTLTGRTVRDVLCDPDRFVGETLADPVEGISYGRCKAKIMRRADGTLWIHSFAHGRTMYALKFDAADEFEAVESDLATDQVVARLNKNNALVIVGDKTVILKEQSDGEIQLLSLSAFENWFRNKHVMRGEKPVPVAKYWMSHPERRQYEGLVFAPGRDVPGRYNLWRGFATEPRPGDCSKFLAHIRDNVCRGDLALYDWVIGWFAHIVQHPGEKTGTALVLRGKQGTGKTKVGQVIGSLLGSHYTSVAEPRFITGRFNSHLASCLVLHADEGFWAGDHAAEGKLKDLITGTDHLIEYKGKEPVKVRNYSRLLVTGNPDWLVPAGYEERRFAVLDVGEDRMQDIPYFEAIDHEMDNGGREALLDHLLQSDLTKVNLRVIPKTDALLDQKMSSFTGEQSWWYAMLSNGVLPWGCDAERCCPAQALHDSYIEHASRAGIRRRGDATKIGIFLTKHVPTVRKYRRTHTAKRPGDRAITEKHGYVYEFPPLADCRAAFEKMIQQSVEWPAQDDWQTEGRECAAGDFSETGDVEDLFG